MHIDEEHRIESARVEALYRFAKSAYATTLAIAALVMVVLWGPLNADALVGWFFAVLATTLARIGLHWSYARTAPEARVPRTWERRFVLGAFASGALWAYAAAVFFPASDPLLQTVLIFVVVGSGLGAIGIYGSSMPAFFAFLTLPMAATILQLASQPGRSYQMLAMLVLLFAGVAAWVYRGIHLNFIDMLRARHGNEILTDRLAASEARLRDAIESFPEGIAVFDEAGSLVICNDAYAHTAAEAGPASVDGAPGGLRTVQLSDGRWLQGRIERTRAGGTVSVLVDISELKRAQDAYLGLLAEENLVLDTLPVGVAFLRDRNIVRCNGLLERMLGYSPGELAGRPVREIYFTEQYWRQGVDFYDRVADGSVFEIDGPLRRKDGTRTWVHMQMRAANPESPRESAILAFMDIGARRDAERSLKRSEAMYRNLVETSNDLIWASDGEGRWSYLNGAASQRIYGFEPTELLGRPIRERVAAEVMERDIAVFQRVLAGEAVYNYETRHLRKDGSTVDLSFNTIPLRDSRGGIVGATGTARDITDQKLAAAALHESVEKLRLSADAADLYYWEWDIDADAVVWGRDPAGLIGSPDEASTAWPELRRLVHPEDKERYEAAARKALEPGEGYRCEFRIVTPGGETRWIVSEGKLMRGRDGAARRMLGASRDVTQAKRQEEEARFLAYHDTLTGLPNRRLLDDRLKQAIFLAQRRDVRVGVMLVDLDNFKQVNDSLGHRAGDAVLREASRRLASCVRKADTLARQGGDEFVIVMPDLALEADCQVVAEKILRALEPECVVDGQAFRIGASIGISVFPADAGDGEGLLRNADVAMYRAKQLGRNNYRFYGR